MNERRSNPGSSTKTDQVQSSAQPDATAPALQALTRRGFCHASSAFVVGLGLWGCGSGSQDTDAGGGPAGDAGGGEGRISGGDAGGDGGSIDAGAGEAGADDAGAGDAAAGDAAAGDGGTPTQRWARFFTSSALAKASPALYRYGKSGFQLQFCHGGDRSPVNPNKAMMIMDVALGWVTENAEDDWPAWRHTKSLGVGNRYSVAVKFDPTDEDRLIYAISNRAKGAGGGGLYLSSDLGESYTKVLALSNIPGGSGSSYGGLYRIYRHVIDYDPKHHDTWYFGNAEDGIYRSTDRGATWSKISGAPATQSWGVCYFLKVSHASSNTLWAATSTGLRRSTDGGKTWAKHTPSGLPSGEITSASFSPLDGKDFFVVVFDKGLYRTTDGGATFAKVKASHDSVCQVAVSDADRDTIWLLTHNRSASGHPNKKSLYSKDGGKSWHDVTADPFTYGQEIPPWQQPLRAVGHKGTHDGFAMIGLQDVILPSPLQASRAIATSQAMIWRTNNAKHWVNASDGFDNLAAGEANLNAVAWAPSDPTQSCWVFFDYGPYVSRDNLDSFNKCQLVSPGIDHAVGGGSCAIHPTDPNLWLMTRGAYINPVTLLVSTDGGRTVGKSFKPSFYANSTYGERVHWCDWHPTNHSVGYSQKGISFDRGVSWQKWRDRATDKTLANNGCDTDERASGVHGRSAADGDVLYAFNNSCKTICRSVNLGKTWAVITQNGGPGASRDQPYSFLPDPHDADVAWWWVTGQGLKRFEAGSGITTHASGWAQVNVGRVRVSPLDGDQIYLLASMGSNGGVFVLRSTHGASGPFEDISGNIPRVGANRSMEIHPVSGIVFVVGTAGTRIFPPPGGHPRFDALAARFGY